MFKSYIYKYMSWSIKVLHKTVKGLYSISKKMHVEETAL